MQATEIERDFFSILATFLGHFFLKNEHAQPRLLICSKMAFMTLLICLLPPFIGLDKQTI